jgi:thiol-disulfide isomerase/thioredoxin
MSFVLRYAILVCALSVGFGACNSNEEEELVEYLTPDKISDEEFGTYVDSLLNQTNFIDYNGNMVKVSDFKGKAVVIDFWETWCSPCLRTFPSLYRAISEYPNDFVVLAVNLGESDTDEAVKQFISEHPEYQFVWVRDHEGLAQTLNLPGIPYKIYLNRDGNYTKHELGLSGSDEKNYTNFVEFITSTAESKK